MKNLLNKAGALAVAAALSAAATARAADYAADGPLTVTVSDLPAQTGINGGKLVVPDGPGPYPLLVTSHGASATADNQVGWAKHFATYGFVVVVPTFPGLDHQANADAIGALVTKYADPATDSPARGKVDGSKIGLEGHSAGGLATAVAAAALQPTAVVLFDPVDASNLGQPAMAKIASPLLEIFADPSGCNANSNWSAFKDTSTGPKVLLHVIGSSHCDGENADRGVLCGLVCGGNPDANRQKRYAHYATAQLLAFLDGDATAAAELCEAKLAADSTIEDTESAGVPGCAAGPPPDLAGAPSDMAAGGGGGGGGGTDGGGTGGGGGGDGGGGGGGGGGGCAFVQGGGSGLAATLVLLLIVLAGVRRARRLSGRRT